MNDPHVEALVYSIEHAESYDYSDSAPVNLEIEDFKVRVENGRVRFELNEHFSSVAAAKEIVDRFVEVWELDAFLRRPREKFRLTYDRAELIDRSPVPGKIQLQANPITIHFEVSQPTITVGTNYPDPPKEIDLDPNDDIVVIMTRRLKQYMEDRQDLLSVAYFCLTILEDSAGGRKKAAGKYGIVFGDLDKVGHLTGNKGGELSARKAAGVNSDLTEEEARFLERAVAVMIRRASERALRPSMPFDRIRI